MVDLGFIGSCMVHKGDMQILAQMLRNLERIHGSVEFKAPLVVADTAEKKGESLLASTPLVVLSTFLGRVPTIEEYKASVAGIKLTSYAPPLKELTEN